MKINTYHVLLRNIFVASFAVFIFSTFAYAQDKENNEDVQKQLQILISNNAPNKKSVEEVQNLLANLGYDPGPIDGALGAMTQSALKKWESTTEYKVPKTWMTPPSETVSRSGWRCVSREKADSHNGPTICGGEFRRLTTEQNGSILMYGNNAGWSWCGENGLAKCEGINFYTNQGMIKSSIPTPSGSCAECEIYSK